MKKTPPPYPPSAMVPSAARPDSITVAAPLPASVVADLQQHATTARAPSTVQAYKADWATWLAWCERMRQVPFPASPVAVAAFASEQSKSGWKYATIRRCLSTISRWHTLRNQPSPTKTNEVRLVLDSIARTKGTKQKQMDPLTLQELGEMLKHTPATLSGLRDRAMLLTGFHGAFRSSELAALLVEDLDWRAEGVVVTVRRSKTDQTGEGFEKPIQRTDDNFCAYRALQQWVQISKLTSGPLFRPINRYGQKLGRGLTRTVVNNIIKEYTKAAGIDPRRFASHSLRAGYVTQALDDANDPLLIAGMTGHKSLDMIKRYDRRKKRNPFAGVAKIRTKKES